MAFKLRYEAYKSGKETINFLLEAIKLRVASKLEAADNNGSAIRTALEEALDSAKAIEAIANAKYKAGSATFLEFTTVKVDRLNYELRLLRLDKPTK
ncbi:MAG: hypothetical protein QM703_10645 [Gemmatales bacterium]